MSRTAFTASEWSDFEAGFDDPEDAWKVACNIWEGERFHDIEEWQKFVKGLENENDKKYGLDLLEALYALYTTESSVYHEIEGRFKAWAYDKGYRKYNEGYSYESQSYF